MAVHSNEKIDQFFASKNPRWPKDIEDEIRKRWELVIQDYFYEERLQRKYKQKHPEIFSKSNQSPKIKRRKADRRTGNAKEGRALTLVLLECISRSLFDFPVEEQSLVKIHDLNDHLNEFISFSFAMNQEAAVALRRPRIIYFIIALSTYAWDNKNPLSQRNLANRWLKELLGTLQAPLGGAKRINPIDIQKLYLENAELEDCLKKSARNDSLDSDLIKICERLDVNLSVKEANNWPGHSPHLIRLEILSKKYDRSMSTIGKKLSDARKERKSQPRFDDLFCYWAENEINRLASQLKATQNK